MRSKARLHELLRCSLDSITSYMTKDAMMAREMSRTDAQAGLQLSTTKHTYRVQDSFWKKIHRSREELVAFPLTQLRHEADT